MTFGRAINGAIVCERGPSYWTPRRRDEAICFMSLWQAALLNGRTWRQKADLYKPGINRPQFSGVPGRAQNTIPISQTCAKGWKARRKKMEPSDERSEVPKSKGRKFEQIEPKERACYRRTRWIPVKRWRSNQGKGLTR